MRRVTILTPWRDCPSARTYLRAALRDSALRGETPYASHAMMAATGALDDADEIERGLGMSCERAWIEASAAVVAYVDLGISPGMRAGMETAGEVGVPLEHRSAAWAQEELDECHDAIRRIRTLATEGEARKRAAVTLSQLDSRRVRAEWTLSLLRTFAA